MNVSELKDNVDLSEQEIVASVYRVNLKEDGLHGILPDGPVQYDHLGNKALCRYLGINPGYIEKCPQDLKEDNVNHWLAAASPEITATFHVQDGWLTAVHDAEDQVFTIKAAIDVVSDTLDDDDVVVDTKRTTDKFILDIVRPTNFTMLQDEKVLAGLRLSVYPTKAKAPEVLGLLHWEERGTSVTIPQDEIDIRSLDIYEAMEELSRVIESLMDGGQDLISMLVNTSDIKMEEPVNRFAHNLLKEHGLSARVRSQVMEDMENLPAEPTYLDFSRMLQEISLVVTYRSEVKLQALCGDLVANTNEIMHRCEECLQSLDD